MKYFKINQKEKFKQINLKATYNGIHFMATM